MGIYNYTALKGSPLKICIPLESGLAPEVDVHRVKWHGCDGSLRWGTKIPFQQPGDWCYFDIIARRAEWAWKGQEPSYLIETSGYKGKLDWNDEYHREHGYRVFESNQIAWQEYDGFGKHIGDLFKLGRGKYNFIPKVLEQESRQSL